MAKDDHSIARAGLYGAAATFTGSAAMSLAVAKISNTSAPDWVWWLCIALAIIAFFLGILALRYWQHGLNPHVPKKAMRVEEILRIVDSYFPESNQGAMPVLTAFLQDARDGRQRLWGRLEDDDDFLRFIGRDELPLSYIPPDYWQSARIHWLEAKSEPVNDASEVYRDLIVSDHALRWKWRIDKWRGRFK